MCATKSTSTIVRGNDYYNNYKVPYQWKKISLISQNNMALWVWRFVEGDPPHFFHAPSL